MADLPAVPDYYGQFMAPLQRQQQINIEQQNANLQQSQVAMQEQQQTAKLRQLQAFQSDAQSVISNPTPEGYRSLMLKYPDQYEGIKASWGEYSDAQKETDVNAAGQVYASLSNGRSDLALQLLRDRKSAEASAGKDTKMTDSMIDLVSSGDPTKLKQAQGIAGFVLASSAGPDKIGPMLESLNKGHDSYTLAPGDIRYDENGGIVAQSPYIKGADGTLYERDGSGTAPAPGSSTAPAAGAGAGAGSAIDHVLGNEGGYLAKDGNGYPTNFGINAKANSAELSKLHIADLRLMTKDQAKQIYQDKYWPASGAENLPANLQAPYFDVYIRSPDFAKVALAKSGHDPVKFMQLAQDYFQKLAAQPKYARFAKAWANRDASNMAIASGQAPAPGGTDGVQSPATAPPGFHTLIPGKPDGVPSGYEPDPAKPGALRPIPGGPADKPGSAPPSDQELSDAATQFLLTGQMPALGMGAGGLRQQILAKRSEIMKNLGIPAEQLPAFQAQYKADQNALTKTSELASNLQSSENALKANAQQVWNTHRTLVADGIISDNPWITRQRLKYYTQFGDPDQRAHVKTYLDAVNAYSTEYSKFMTAANGMGGSAAPSDSARSQAGELNDTGMAATPLLGHLRQGLIEATNKRNGVVQQQNALQHKLSNYLHPHSSSEPAGDDWITLPSGLKIRKIH